jgi:hypothetical protein
MLGSVARRQDIVRIMSIALPSVRVTQFMRRPRPTDFSLERVFEDVRAELPHDCEVKVWRCRNLSTGILPRLADMLRARYSQGDVNHVTGDVHYLTFLLNPMRTVLTIHDLVLLEQGNGLKRLVYKFFWYWLPVRRCLLFRKKRVSF